MPCTYTGSIQGDEIYSLKKLVIDLKGDLDELTLMLCALCSFLETTELRVQDLMFAAASRADGLETEEIWDWWQNHKKEDEERKLYLKLKEKYGD